MDEGDTGFSVPTLSLLECRGPVYVRITKGSGERGLDGGNHLRTSRHSKIEDFYRVTGGYSNI